MEEAQVSTVKACIISRKGGIPVSELNSDYKELVGENISYRHLGFKSLVQYLESIDGVSVKGDVIHCTAKESRHIQAMISKQKTKTNGRKRKPNNNDNIYPPSKKRMEYKNPRQKSPPKAYYYDPQNCAFQKNIFMFNHAYDEYDCIFGEKNLIYNLVYSLCQILNQAKIKISSCVSNNITGDSMWIQALRNKPPIFYSAKTCIQTRGDSNVILYGHQVVGDDSMIELIGDHFGFIAGGTCLHGLTLKEAQQQFIRKQCAQNILILCGSLDIHNGVLLEQVVKDMQDLILCILLSGCTPVVCNIPPSPYWWLNHQISAFNYWLTTLTNITIIDLYSPFINEYSHINYNYFTRNPINVRRSRIYLWSKVGQDVVINTLLRTLRFSF